MSRQHNGHGRAGEGAGAATAQTDDRRDGQLGDVAIPALAIAAADDPSTPPSELEAIAGEIPESRLVVLEDARHLVNVERADEFNAAILSFLCPSSSSRCPGS